MQAANYLLIFIAAVVAFIVSMLYYIIFAKERQKLSKAATEKRPKPKKIIIELIRNIILASVISYLVAKLGIVTLTSALGLAFILWIGFPLILLSGSVTWEKVHWKLAAIHSGDWFLKLLFICSILTIWH